MANDPRPGLTPVETPCGQAMARNAGDMPLYIYILMYVLNMYAETRQARKFNPAYALQETTSNAWDLPGRVTPDIGSLKFQAWHIWFWQPLISGTVLDTTGLFWI